MRISMTAHSQEEGGDLKWSVAGTISKDSISAAMSGEVTWATHARGAVQDGQLLPDFSRSSLFEPECSEPACEAVYSSLRH